MPQADIRLIEDDYAAPVQHCGHGLQRAFIVALLQRLAFEEMQREESAESVSTDTLANLVLVIEEPELYQHPTRQRHFARILQQLASVPEAGVADRIQVIYTTHSPLFVGIDRIEALRALRKVPSEDGLPRVTQTLTVRLSDVAEELWNAHGAQGDRYTAETLQPRLTTLMTPWMNEGFFAKTAVLVEGEDDRAALLGMARLMDVDFDALGISVIPCHGKTNIDRPASIFRALKIPVYLVWDSDMGKSDARPEENHGLLRLVGSEPVDWPAAVDTRYACFERDLDATLKEEIGEAVFFEVLDEAKREFGIRKHKHALKNPNVVSRLVEKGEERGGPCTTLRAIVQRISELRSAS